MSSPTPNKCYEYNTTNWGPNCTMQGCEKNAIYGLKEVHEDRCSNIVDANCTWKTMSGGGVLASGASAGPERGYCKIDDPHRSDPPPSSICEDSNAPGRTPCAESAPPDNTASHACIEAELKKAQIAREVQAHTEEMHALESWSPIPCLTCWIEAGRARNQASVQNGLDINTKLSEQQINSSFQACTSRQTSIQTNTVDLTACNATTNEEWRDGWGQPPKAEYSDIKMINDNTQDITCKLAAVQNLASEMDSSNEIETIMSAKQDAQGPMTNNDVVQGNCNAIDTNISSCQYNSQKSCCDQQQSSIQTNILKSCGPNISFKHLDMENVSNQHSQCLQGATQSSEASASTKNHIKQTIMTEEKAAIGCGGCCFSYCCYCCCIILGIGGVAKKKIIGGGDGGDNTISVLLKLGAAACMMFSLCLTIYLAYKYYIITKNGPETNAINAFCKTIDSDDTKKKQCCDYKTEYGDGPDKLQDNEDAEDFNRERMECINWAKMADRFEPLLEEYQKNLKCLKIDGDGNDVTNAEDGGNDCKLTTENNWHGSGGGEGALNVKPYQSCTATGDGGGVWGKYDQTTLGDSKCALFVRPDNTKDWDSSQIAEIKSANGTGNKNASAYLYTDPRHPINTNDNFCDNLDEYYGNDGIPAQNGMTEAVRNAIKQKYNTCCEMPNGTDVEKEKRWFCLKRVAQQESGVRLPVQT
jgi:hypothetical protein